MRRPVLALVAVLVATCAHAKSLGSVGTTYEIAEKDALAEIEERAKGVDWGKVMQRKAVEDYDGPKDRITLPRAGRDRTFTVNMSYTLQMDIPDGKGGILYPKGYTFNPLDYVVFAKTLVVINGSDPEQVKWFAASEYRNRLDVMLLLTEGRYARLGKKLNVSLFYADSQLVERLQLAAVPSIIRQEGREMAVREVAVPRKATNSKAGVLPGSGGNLE